MISVDMLGSFPVDGRLGRERKELYRISREEMLYTIHGNQHPIPLTFFISNDFCHMGELTIPVGEGSRASEADVHKGDAVIYVEIGPITFFLPDTSEVLVAEEGDAVFLPAGTEYHCINYTKHNVKGIFMIAPDL